MSFSFLDLFGFQFAKEILRNLLSDLKAAFRSWFIVGDGWNELQKSGSSNSRRQIVQLSSRSISAGNLVFSS